MISAEYEQIEARARYGANDIRPGLTGWAQINGRDAVTVEEKARLDRCWLSLPVFAHAIVCPLCWSCDGVWDRGGGCGRQNGWRFG